eukprot:PhM_4_TR15189/c0_g2_i2/m.41355
MNPSFWYCFVLFCLCVSLVVCVLLYHVHDVAVQNRCRVKPPHEVHVPICRHRAVLQDVLRWEARRQDGHVGGVREVVLGAPVDGHLRTRVELRRVLRRRLGAVVHLRVARAVVVHLVAAVADDLPVVHHVPHGRARRVVLSRRVQLCVVDVCRVRATGEDPHEVVAVDAVLLAAHERQRVHEPVVSEEEFLAEQRHDLINAELGDEAEEEAALLADEGHRCKGHEKVHLGGVLAAHRREGREGLPRALRVPHPRELRAVRELEDVVDLRGDVVLGHEVHVDRRPVLRVVLREVRVVAAEGVAARVAHPDVVAGVVQEARQVLLGVVVHYPREGGVNEPVLQEDGVRLRRRVADHLRGNVQRVEEEPVLREHGVVLARVPEVGDLVADVWDLTSGDDFLRHEARDQVGIHGGSARLELSGVRGNCDERRDDDETHDRRTKFHCSLQ